jgi:hypothetical protein
MTATRQDIEGWFDRGLNQGSDFMIIVCDTFDYEDYPVYASKADYKAAHSSHNGKNMGRVMEVYDLSMDKDTQMDEHRAFHPPVSE